MRKKPGDAAIRSAGHLVVPEGGEPPSYLRASIRYAATNARRWQDKVLARAASEDRILTCAAIGLAVLIAFGLRAFRLGVSWEISEDEIDYLQISHGVLRTLWVVGWDGGPFYLHPPGLFFLEAAYIKLFGIGGDLISQIYGVRYLIAAIGGLSAGALLWLGRLLAGWLAGIVAAATFALDPFCIRMNSRNFLEAPTVLWVLLGYGVLFSALTREDRRPVSWRRTVAAGVLFGLALLTKEKSVFVTLLPLGICFALGWALPRAQLAVAGLAALLVYTPYPAIAYAIGDWGTFLDQKSAGVSRLVGLIQLTGFNQQGGPSLVDAIVTRVDEFATTYVFLGTGALAVGVLLLTDLGRTPARRLLVSWTSSAYVFLAYSMFFGTLEEHFFYYLAVSSILTTTVTTALVLRKLRVGGGVRWARTEQRRRVALEAGAVCLVTLALWSVCVWVVVHTAPDNGYQRVVSYLDELPEGSRIAVTSETAEPLIIYHAGVGPYNSVRALQADNIDYVVISSYLATRGWREPTPGVYRWVKGHGQLVYGFKGSSSGLLGVWQLQDRTERATLAPEVAGGGGVANPWLGPAFLVLMATNVVIYSFLRWMQGQLSKNDQSLLENEKSLLLELWGPDRQRRVDKRA